MTTTPHLASSRVRVPESFAEMQDYFWEQGWTDGLPVVPPTEDAVRGMLAAMDADPQHSLGVMQPRNSRATLESWPSTPSWPAASPNTSRWWSPGCGQPCVKASTSLALRPPPAAPYRS